MTCVKSKDYNLSGDAYTDDFKYVEVILRKCTGPTCKSSADIKKVIDHLDLTFMVVNAYLDFHDFHDPVKHFLDDILFYHLEYNRHKRANIYVMESEVVLEDEIF